MARGDTPPGAPFSFVYVRPHTGTRPNFAGVVKTPSAKLRRRPKTPHTAQMRETGYVGFYLLYLAEWLWRWARLKDATAAYRAIRFEREAYGHQDELDYLAYRRPFAWTRERSL